VQKDLQRHFLQIGGYGINPATRDLRPARISSETGADVNYQFTLNANEGSGDILSIHASVIHEARGFETSHRLLGAGLAASHNIFLADASWSIGETITPSIQYFQT